MTKQQKHPYPTEISIPLEVVRLDDNSFHITIPAEINGVKGILIIDTGASVSVVDKTIVAADGNETEQNSTLKSTGLQSDLNDVSLVTIKKLKIGSRSFKNKIFAAISMDNVKTIYNKCSLPIVIGLLGCDFCVEESVKMDFEKKILRIPIQKRTKNLL